MNRTRRIIRNFFNDICVFFPYFFSFYVLSLLLSLIFPSWKLFFNWRAFTISVVVLGIFSLWSARAQSLRDIIFLRSKKREFLLILQSLKKIPSIAALSFKHLFVLSINLWKGLGRRGQIKVGIIAAVLIFAITRSIGMIDFIVLAYALASMLFIFESKMPVVLVMILLTICPLLILFKKDELANISAIYAFYFLLITVVTEIMLYIKDDLNKQAN
jgi:hypothetical protein